MMFALGLGIGLAVGVYLGYLAGVWTMEQHHAWGQLEGHAHAVNAQLDRALADEEVVG